jgi:transcriptional regulator
MYLPAHFEEARTEVVHKLIRDQPLATVVTLSSTGLTANHIPLEVDSEPPPFGTLRGHVARANPMWRDFSSEMGALAIFQGPQMYITPSWYRTTKETGKVVPTWNYVVAHASGALRIIDDREWLRNFVTQLTDRFEAGLPRPWKVADAPADFIDKQLAGIVGIEIPIVKLTGKWKVSQNRTHADREGVVEGLGETAGAEAREMADLVRERMLR